MTNLSKITESGIKGSNRIVSIDFLKGIIMVLMSIDHVRWFYHINARAFDPLDLSQTSTILFLTRWVTHFCAPLFIFLAGTSVFFMRQHRSKGEVSHFLLTRGLFLIFLELTLFRFFWSPNILRPGFGLLVIWCIGITMVIMAALIYLSDKQIRIIGLLIFFSHNLLQNVSFPEGSFLHGIWAILYSGGVFELGPLYISVLFAFYPFIGMICLGYSFGSLYKSDYDPIKRKQHLLMLGYVTIGLFVLLRITNLYGDPTEWHLANSFRDSVLSFINTTKYPLSLQFSLMTLGPAFFLLAFSEQLNNIITKPFILFGKVPMFYYSLHLCFIPFSEYILSRIVFGKIAIQQFSLVVVYIVIVLVNILLYWCCRKFLQYKKLNPEKRWLRYI